MSSLNEIGTRIKALREAKGLTQAELGQYVNASRELVNMWERGARDLKTGTIIELAHFFNVSCDYILTGVEAQHLDIHETLGLSEDAIKMLCILCQDSKSESKYHRFSKGIIKAVNRMIENEFGRLIMYRISNYLEMDFSHLFSIPMEDNHNKHGDKIQISHLDNAVFAVTGTDDKNSADIVSVPLGTFETSYILDLLEVVKQWKREGGKGYASQINP